MTRFDRAVYGVLELAEQGVISYGRAAEVTGLTMMELREYVWTRPAVIQRDRERAVNRKLELKRKKAK